MAWAKTISHNSQQTFLPDKNSIGLRPDLNSAGFFFIVVETNYKKRGEKKKRGGGRKKRGEEKRRGKEEGEGRGKRRE